MLISLETCILLYATDLVPPHITNIDALESKITVRWTPQPCNNAVMYNVSWMYTNDDGTTTTASGVSDQVTNYTIPTFVQGVYTVSVQAADSMGNVGPAASELVKSSEYYSSTLYLDDSVMINSSLCSLPSTHY